MSRTPEQVAADDALTAAIENVHRVYHDGGSGVLTDYLVIAQRKYWDDGGEQVTQVLPHPRDDGGVPITTLLGMLDFVTVRYRKIVAED